MIYGLHNDLRLFRDERALTRALIAFDHLRVHRGTR